MDMYRCDKCIEDMKVFNLTDYFIIRQYQVSSWAELDIRNF